MQYSADCFGRLGGDEGLADADLGNALVDGVKGILEFGEHAAGDNAFGLQAQEVLFGNVWDE